MQRPSLDAAYFLEKFGVDLWDEFRPVYDRFQGEELLDRHNGTIKLTRRGLLKVDEILWEFFEPELKSVRYA